MRKTIKIYTKFCLECLFKNESQKISSWARTENYNLKIYRTAYDPIKHAVATRLNGSDAYVSIVQFDGKIYTLKSFVENIVEKKRKSKK